MSTIMRSVRNAARGYSSAQILVRDATSDEPTWPTEDQLKAIAKASLVSSTDFYEVVEMLEKRLTDKKKKGRHVLKALTVCDYLVHKGSMLVVRWARQNIQIFDLLHDFEYIDSSGVDIGETIRFNALGFTTLVSDDNRIEEERSPKWKPRAYDIGFSTSKTDIEREPVERPLSEVNPIFIDQAYPSNEPVQNKTLDIYSKGAKKLLGEGARSTQGTGENQDSQTSLEISNTQQNTVTKYQPSLSTYDSVSTKPPAASSEAAKKLLGEGARSTQEKSENHDPGVSPKLLDTQGNKLAKTEAPSSSYVSALTASPDILSEAAKKLLGEGARSTQEEQPMDDERQKENSPTVKGGMNQISPDGKRKGIEASVVTQATQQNDEYNRSGPSDVAKELRASPLRPKLPSTSVSSTKVYRQVSDLVRDSKLETLFPDGTVTQHIYYVSDMKTQRRRVRKEARWSVVRKLAAGSFGQVWLQQCTEGDDVGKLRAVKEISRGRDEQPDIDYQRELEAIAKFSHEKYVHCFVKSFGWYERDHTVFIAMEYFEKGDLQSYLVKPFPEAETQEVSLQVLEGLSFMHDNGFAHRDLKPGNILVSSPSPNWWVKISDFGISKRAEEEQTAFRTMVGTKGYLAPEVIGIFSSDDVNVNEENDESYTVVVDIWALGAIAFRMLTNRNAFSEPRKLWNYVVLNQPFPEELLVEAGVTQACRDLLAKLMAAAPSMRPSAIMALCHPWMMAAGLPAQLNSSDISDKQAENLQDSGYDSTATASWTAVLTQAPTSKQDATISQSRT